MKTKFTILAILLSLVTTFSFAQENNGRQRVYVENFTYTDDTPESFAELVREYVMNGLNEADRFDLVDANLDASMQAEMERRSSEAAMADEKTRNQVLSAAGHDFLISGKVVKYSISVSKLDDGTPMYTCLMSYSITVTDVATSTSVASKTFDHGALGGFLTLSYTSEQEAVNASVKQIKKDMISFLSEEFPLEGLFVPMDYEVKAGKLQSCYIELGSAVGVKENDKFSLMIPTVRAGRVTYKEVAEMKVEEVIDETLSGCKIIKNHKPAFEAINAYFQLDEATRTQYPILVKSCSKAGSII